MQPRVHWKNLGITPITSLIFLIACIIIAIITSTSLTNIVNKISEQSEKTSQETLWQVASGLKIITIYGDRKENSWESSPLNQSIQVIYLKVTLYPGSEAINLRELVIQVSVKNTTVDLKLNTTGTNATHANATLFVVTSVRDDDNSLNNFILSTGDIALLIISTDTEATNLDLTPSKQCIIKLHPKHATTTISKFTTPSAYTTRYIELQ